MDCPKVGSKMDKESSRAVRWEEGENLARRHGCSFCEISSKTRQNVRKPFVELVDQIVSNPQLMSEVRARQRGGALRVAGSAASDTGWGSSCYC